MATIEEVRRAMIKGERTGDWLRQTLRRLEADDMCYSDEPYPGEYWTVWIDKVNGDDDIYFAYETDNLGLRVDDLTDENLKNVIIGRF